MTKPNHVLGGLAVLLAGQSMAQVAEPPDAAELEEVIITAQKREQSLSDVSMAVSAIGADELVNTQTQSLESLQYLVPSISFGNDFNFAKLFIRGIGLNSSFPGADPSVAFHVDGAVHCPSRRADERHVRSGPRRGAARPAGDTLRPQCHGRCGRSDHRQADR